MIRALFYGPGDWLATRFTARQRRAIATWILIASLLSTPFQWPFRDRVSLVWALSQIALWLAMLGVVSAETPVESENSKTSELEPRER